MRALLAGLFILTFISTGFAQVKGEVESIGFGGDGLYRPQCWTPMIVRLESTIDEPAEYRVEVHQRDLDFDHVIYVKEGITLNGHAIQRWQVCFLPDPTNGGLPDQSLSELQDRVRVYVTTKDGSRQIAQCPITSTIRSLESGGSMMNQPRDYKLILAVVGRGGLVSSGGYQDALGLIEQPQFIRVDARDLPHTALAYDAVDAVLWMGGDARVLSEEGSTQFTALQQWIRAGGTLVVCQPADSDRMQISPFADMLPIVWQQDGQWRVANADKADAQPLSGLGKWRQPNRPAWPGKGPFTFARATTRPSAVVSEWIDWKADSSDRTPYIARMGYGLGSITWVAQDLSLPSLNNGATSGSWPYVWDQVFGWKNDTRVKVDQEKRDEDLYSQSLGTAPVKLGDSQVHGVEFGAKGAGLITLAVLFFIVYWLVAGPGSYLILAARKQTAHSWTIFAASALGATLLTVVVVDLVLRGNPEIHHATTLRMAQGPDAPPAIADSKIGLYIPRDGDQHISLDGVAPDQISYITPLAANPADVPSNDFPASLDYRVPIRDAADGKGPAIDVPFRSTLKKLAASWCGSVSPMVRAYNIRLNDSGDIKQPITGLLDNVSGVHLENVYIAFNYFGKDYILYVPDWSNAAGLNRLDLAVLLSKAKQLPFRGSAGNKDNAMPANLCFGEVADRWGYYWSNALVHLDPVDDINASVPTAFPVLSFFDRIPPSTNEKGAREAVTYLRRGERGLNLSGALGAGRLVVLADSDRQPLPFPLLVNGSAVAGEGRMFYQFVFTIDRTAADAVAASSR